MNIQKIVAYATFSSVFGYFAWVLIPNETPCDPSCQAKQMLQYEGNLPENKMEQLVQLIETGLLSPEETAQACRRIDREVHHFYVRDALDTESKVIESWKNRILRYCPSLPD